MFGFQRPVARIERTVGSDFMAGGMTEETPEGGSDGWRMQISRGCRRRLVDEAGG